jgi:hypothetical protein
MLPFGNGFARYNTNQQSTINPMAISIGMAGKILFLIAGFSTSVDFHFPCKCIDIFNVALGGCLI